MSGPDRLVVYSERHPAPTLTRDNLGIYVNSHRVSDEDLERGWFDADAYLHDS